LLWLTLPPIIRPAYPCHTHAPAVSSRLSNDPTGRVMCLFLM
jgi:hypothetical protein